MQQTHSRKPDTYHATPSASSSWASVLCNKGACSAGEVVARHSVGEPCSAPVVCDAGCRQAFVATLRGTVMALAYPGSLGGALRTVWRASAGAPVISAPAFLAAQRSLVVATVQGCVRGFSSARGGELALPLGCPPEPHQAGLRRLFLTILVGILVGGALDGTHAWSQSGLQHHGALAHVC